MAESYTEPDDNDMPALGGPFCALIVPLTWACGSNLRPQRHPHALAFPPRPLRLNLYDSLYSGGVVVEAAPGPILWFFHQSPLHWITVHISQLFDALGRPPHIEIIVTGLPEGRAYVLVASFGAHPLARGWREGWGTRTVGPSFWAVICFIIWMAIASVLRSGSLINR